MPLTAKGSEILRNMEQEYGTENGKHVFYASKNKGTISGVDATVPVSYVTVRGIGGGSAGGGGGGTLAAKLDAIMAGCDRLDARIDAHIGFEKLKNELAHKKGIHNPAAVAAAIGREKYGAKAMAKKAAAGRK